jgi:pyrroloquinoline quinone biosynthesis protein B
MKWLLCLLTLSIIFSCQDKRPAAVHEMPDEDLSSMTPASKLVVLGTIQDAGSPHIACKKDCCKALFNLPDPDRKVVSLGLIHRGKTYLFEATPDMSTQLKSLQSMAGSESEFPDGIFLTHAHIGHYTGLMYLGKEATNSSEVPVYAMPRMKQFLETNGPWNALVENKNISLRDLADSEKVSLTDGLDVTPLLVPHRDEYSETVGFLIECNTKKILFIPDIDKWEKWNLSIIEKISEIDHAFVDATFFSGEEINNRDISEIPHPFIIESMAMFDTLANSEKNKIHFIHFNHTNPVLDTSSAAYKNVINAGYRIARIHDVIKL